MQENPGFSLPLTEAGRMTARSEASIRAALRKYFGYDEFRFFQKDVITRTLAGRNSLVIMPTGGGKSLCYQLPAVLLDGVTLVISPLIALMQDQVLALKANGITAEALNSHCSAEEERAVRVAVEERRLALLYVSPERALSPGFLRWIRLQPVRQVAIDEVHCVSIWGNDFRKDYRELSTLIEQLPAGVPVVALTATADPGTRVDILRQLRLPDCETFVASFERPNIHVEVYPATDRVQAIKTYLRENPGQPGIIYCLSRKSTEELAAKLRQHGIRARHYHARVDAPERQQVQDAFQRDEIDVICATIAFGMGIDKPNIRWVMHYNLPKNLESYYQEIGRAGRDGEPAEALLFAGLGDRRTLLDMIDDNSEADPAYKAVQKEKVFRMWEYTQTTACRTNLVLSYFGEHRETPCGHCDICRNPPTRFDGTVIAQKALSVAARTGGRAGMNLMIRILRGQRSAEVVAAGYDSLKTFGCGNDIGWDDWLHYITQLIDLGLLAIDYSDASTLKLTPLAQAYLVKNPEKALELSAPRHERPAARTLRQSPEATPEDEGLYLALVKLRRQICAETGNPPAFTVFSNATLRDIAAAKPQTLDAFGRIKGVGEKKLERYGERFVAAVREALESPDAFADPW